MVIGKIFLRVACPRLAQESVQEMDSSKPNDASLRAVGIIGTGNFATAMAQRLASAGYDVFMASRRPEERKITLANDDRLSSQSGVRITSVSDCLDCCRLVIVALHSEHFCSVFTPEVTQKAAGKILVDVSNRSSRGVQPSNAKQLAALVPEATVVKAFNTLSAYVLESEAAGGSRLVCVASDDSAARTLVCTLVHDLGFQCQDGGGLNNAWHMEESVLTVFPEWRVAAVLSAVILAFWTSFAILRYYIVNTTKWDQFPIKTLNKVFGAAALTELGLTYLAGTCASFMQIYNGTKYKRFPRWLDALLRSRKQLGLLAFGKIVIHAIMSSLILSPTYVKSWFRPEAILIPVPANQTRDLAVDLTRAWMTWTGELSLLVGILAFVLLCLLAVTSLPAVTQEMNWAEWRLVHAGLGYVMLGLATSHLYVMSLYKWVQAGLPVILFRLSFLSVVLPTVAITLRLVTLLPCVDSYIQRIRRGWERKAASSDQAARPENGSTSTRLAPTSADCKSGSETGATPAGAGNSENGAETLV